MTAVCVMLNKITYKPNRVFLTEEAVGAKSTTDGYSHELRNDGKQGPRSMSLYHKLGDYSLVRILAQRLDSGRRPVTSIEFNAPCRRWQPQNRSPKCSTLQRVPGRDPDTAMPLTHSFNPSAVAAALGISGN